MAPVRRHLTSAGTGIVLRANGLEEHFVGRHSQSEAERAVAIISAEPIVRGLQQLPGGNENCFVSRAADLKINFVLTLQLNLAIVQPSGEKHSAIHLDELLFAKPVMLSCGGLHRL